MILKIIFIRSFIYLSKSHSHTRTHTVFVSLFFVPGCCREHTAASLLVFISLAAITLFSPATSISGLYIVQNTALPRYLPQVLIEQPDTALRPVECCIVSHRICGEPPCTLLETNRAAVRCFLKREPLKGFLSGLVSRPCGVRLPRLRLVYIVTSKNTKKSTSFQGKSCPCFCIRTVRATTGS